MISVIVPSYNKPQYLPECLRSIQAQTFTDWECIVVDDGSPRGDEIRAAAEAMGDPRFRLVRHDVNRGLGAARNTGIREARAEWLIWVDEDDALAETCLEVLIHHAEESGADVVHPQYVNRKSGRMFDRTRIANLAEVLETQRYNPGGFLISKEGMKKAGLYDESETIRLGREDTEWWIRAVAAGLRIHTLAQGLYLYRPNGGTEDEESLDVRASFYEGRIRSYIVRKHARLYQQYSRARRLFLGNGWRLEARRNSVAGARIWSTFCMWRAAWHLRSLKFLREAAAMTVNLARACCTVGKAAFESQSAPAKARQVRVNSQE